MSSYTITVENLIQSHESKAFRKCFIKRRESSTGIFEDNWLDVTPHVKRWGQVKQSMDANRFNEFKFGSVKMTFANDTGLFSPEDEQNSLWFGYPSQQRTLVKIEAGFWHQTLASSGIWVNTQVPGKRAEYDSAKFDQSFWDAAGSIVFEGIISGDVTRTDKNDVSFKVMPKLQLFKEYSARNLNGYTSTGMSASEFMEMVRDHSDSNGNKVFLPFFGNTTSNFVIQTTTVNYDNLDSATAKDIRDKNVWQVIQRLAQAEVYIPYINNQGQFVFSSRDATSTVSFKFYGTGFNPDAVYGHTIKKISAFGKKLSKFYSRVEVKWQEGDTSSSYEVKESTLSVSNSSVAWLNGERTIKINNIWIPDVATAQTVALTVFNEVSALKNEISFNASFVPHLNIFDRFQMYYDSQPFSLDSAWDVRNWSNDAETTQNALVWDNAPGEAIRINGAEYKALSFIIDLDKLETRFIAREV